MATVATLEIEIKGKASGVDTMLKGIDTTLKKTTSSSLSLQQAQARLETQQGNLAGAASRLRAALAQQDTTTVQTINAQRQLLAVETQLATGTSALGAHFKTLQTSLAGTGGSLKTLEGGIAGIGGAIGGLPGQLLSVGSGIGAITLAAGVAVSVFKSFGDAFKFKAELDATTASINAQLKGVRDTSVVYAEAARFANQFKLTQQETTEAIQASIGVMRNSKASVEDILSVLARLQVLSPEQSLQEAAIAVKALASGDTTSLVTRFEVGRDTANQMKKEIQGGADAVAVLSKFLDTSGIGMEALAAKATGASGAFKELAQAQEQLKLAQADFAQGPGLAILQEQIRLTSGATRILSGDFAAMGQSLAGSGVEFAASAAGASAYFEALQRGQGILAAEAAANAAAAQATQLLTNAHSSGGGGAFVFASDVQAAATAALQEAAATAQDTLEQNRLAGAHALGAGSSVAAAQAAQQHTEALIGQIAKTQQAALDAQQLAQMQTTLANLGGAVANGLQTAGNAAAALASQYHIATGEALALINAQAALAQAKVNVAALAEQRSGERSPGRSGVAEAAAQEQRRLNAIFKKLVVPEPKKAKAKGGGGVKLTDQQKLNNQLLTSQEQFANKSEDAEAAHLDRLLQINEDFQDKLAAAQDSFAQSQLDGRAGFYDTLGSIEDAGLRQALAQQYEAAFQEADKIAQEKGADVGEKFLEAKQAAIQAQGKRASEIAEATKEGDKDKAEYLAGVDKLYRDAEARKIAAITEGNGSVAAERDAALAEEGAKYEAAQEKIGTAAERAGDRAIVAAQRRGAAIDAEGLKVDTLKAKYDGVGSAGARAGITPANTAAASATGTPGASTDTSAAGGDPIVAALNAAQAAIVAALGTVAGAAKETTSAVRGLSGKFAS